MHKDQMRAVMHTVFNECDALREQAHGEYAGDPNADCFSNFNRIAADLQMDRKQILLVYAKKHMDGITSFCAGRTAQREDVRGRIDDLITYMTLLRGMIEEDQGMAALVPPPPDPTRFTPPPVFNQQPRPPISGPVSGGPDGPPLSRFERRNMGNV